MKFSYTYMEARQADEATMAGGVSEEMLMERAGAALASRVERVMEERNIPDVLFVCGGGNNGGDGLVAARCLREKGKDAEALLLAERLSDGCKRALEKFGGEVFGRPPRRRYLLLVDCVLGTGCTRPPEGEKKLLVDFINGMGAYVIACDVPSGLTENGIAAGSVVRADETVTFGYKNALLLADGADVAGKITAVEIGISPVKRGAEVWEAGDVSPLFPKRKSHSNKGDYGSAALYAGSRSASGAAFLAAGGCLRSGAGYTRLFVPEELFPSAVGKLPAALLAPFLRAEELLWNTAIAFGMGSGVTEENYRVLCTLLRDYRGTLILDADGLNCLAAYGVEALKEKACNVVITPHPKEFSRLTGKAVGEVLGSAKELTEAFAREYGCIVLLKNNRSIVSDGVRTAIVTTGSPALAKGGSGDVLAGFLAGTCARGVPPFEAACASSYLVGKAGEIAGEALGEYAVTASDVANCLAQAIRLLYKETPR